MTDIRSYCCSTSNLPCASCLIKGICGVQRGASKDKKLRRTTRSQMLCDSELQLWLDDMQDNAVLFDCALTKSSQLRRCVGFATGCAGIVQYGRGIHEGEMDSDSQ